MKSNNKLKSLNSELGKSIINRLVIFGIIMSLLLAMLSTYFEYREEKALLNKQFELIQEHELAAIIESTWTTSKKETALQLNAVIRSMPYVEYASIMTDGKQWVASGERNSKVFIERSFPLEYIKNERVFNLGSLTVVSSIDGVYDKVYQDFMEYLIFSSIFIAITVLLVIFIFEYMITRHLVALSKFINLLIPGHKIKDFELSRKKKSKTKDELDLLTEAINNLKNTSHEFLTKLVESQEQYQAIANYTFDWESWHLPDGNLFWVNPAVERITGFSVKECLDMYDYPLPIISDVDKGKVKDIYKTMVKERTSGNDVTLQITNKNGETGWIAMSWQPIYNIVGEYQGIRSSIRDITERRQAEEAVITSENRYRTLVNNIPGVTYRCDNDNAYTMHYISSEIKEMSGYSHTDFIDNQVRTFTSIVHPDDIDTIRQRIKISNIVGLPFTLEYRILRKDGGVAYVYEKGRSVIDEVDKKSYLEGVIIDITEKKTAMDKAIHSQDEHEKILNTMLDAVITIDEHGLILSANKATADMFGYTAPELIGNSINILIPGKHAAKHDIYLKNMNAAEKPRVMGVDRSIRGIKKSGDEFPLRITIAELPSKDNELRHYVGVCHDITHEEAQEEQIRRSHKMDAIGKLTGGIAHDFNNALGVILGYLELSYEINTDEKLKKFLDNIEGAAKRAANLTSQLLSFSRNRETTPDVVNLNNLIESSQDMIAKTLTARISLHLDLSPDTPPVFIDQSHFEDTLLNMSINAMHAMPETGHLTVSTKKVHIDPQAAMKLSVAQGDYAVVVISDTGVGMSDDIRQKVFDPFFSTKGEQGTGLGLSRVYGFMQQSHGVIDVVSSPGNGTTFFLYFPVYEPETIHSDDMLDEDEVMQGRDVQPLSILVVDDEPTLLNLAEAFLKRNGHRVQTVESAKEALEVMENSDIQLLITDVIMPEMTGNELVKVLSEKKPELPVIVVSGYSESADAKVDLSELNMQIKRLAKPYSEKDLVSAINEVLEQE